MPHQDTFEVRTLSLLYAFAGRTLLDPQQNDLTFLEVLAPELAKRLPKIPGLQCSMSVTHSKSGIYD